MKTIILFTISLFLAGNVLSKDKDNAAFDDTKVIDKTVKATSDFELEISNKHGDVIVENWDKDSISVHIEIRAESDKLKRVHELLEIVDVHISESTDYLSFTTQWGTDAVGVKMDIMRMIGKQTVTVDYLVKVPQGVEIEIDNRFGNVMLGNVEGKLKLDVAYGNINARDVKNGKKIVIQYGKLKIKNIEEADIKASFSDVYIDKAIQLDLDCSSSDVELEEIKKLNLKSRGGDIEIEKVEELIIFSKLSDIEIEELIKSISGSVKYGSFEVEKVVASFSEITLNAGYIDVDLTFESAVAFNYNVLLEAGKSFLIPSEGNTLGKETEDLKEEMHRYEGVFATIPVGGTPAKVNITSKASYIQFSVE